MNRRVTVQECRACLRNVENEVCEELSQMGSASWATPGTIIGEDLAKLANIEISEYDKQSRVICPQCYSQLAIAMTFIRTVQISDRLLKSRAANVSENIKDDMDTSIWPKPILLSKSLNDNIDNQLDVEIKQEIFSEDEYRTDCMDQDWEPQMDIKIEPEEFVAPISSEIFVKGIYSLKGTCEEELHFNGSIDYEEEYLESMVKQEQLSNDELEGPIDLPLNCILCLKEFHSVSGLKAHVIADHSYGTVKRKADDDPLLLKKDIINAFVCATCRKSFETRTDLMVHETCHNKHACFVCDAKFNTFRQLSRHGARCRKRHAPKLRAPRNRPPSRPQSNNNLSKKIQEEPVQVQLKKLRSSKGVKDESLEPGVVPKTLKVLNTDMKETNQPNTPANCASLLSTPVQDTHSVFKILNTDEDGSSQKKVGLETTEENSSQNLLPNINDKLQNSEVPESRKLALNESTEQCIEPKFLNNQEVKEDICKLAMAQKQVSSEQLSNRQEEKGITSEQPIESKQLLNEQEISEQLIEATQLSNEQQIYEKPMKLKQLSNDQEINKQSVDQKQLLHKQEDSEQPIKTKQLSNEEEINEQSVDLKQLSNKQEDSERPINTKSLSDEEEINEQSIEQLFNRQEVSEPTIEPKQIFNEEVIELTVEPKELIYNQDISEQSMVLKQLFSEQDVSQNTIESEQLLSNKQEGKEEINDQPKLLSKKQEEEMWGIEKTLELKQLSSITQEIIEQPIEMEQFLNKEGMIEVSNVPVLETNECGETLANELSPENLMLENPLEDLDNSNTPEDIIPNSDDININLEIKIR